MKAPIIIILSQFLIIIGLIVFILQQRHTSQRLRKEKTCPNKASEQSPQAAIEDKPSFPTTEKVIQLTSTPNDIPKGPKEKELFEQIHQTIKTQQLFLDPNFSREKYIKLSLINKNKVGHLIQQYAGTNLNRYINEMRLEYAAKLMRENPESPIKAIAINSGFNNIRTFYRLFSAKYGVTPTEYKENL